MRPFWVGGGVVEGLADVNGMVWIIWRKHHVSARVKTLSDELMMSS